MAYSDEINLLVDLAGKLAEAYPELNDILGLNDGSFRQSCNDIVNSEGSGNQVDEFFKFCVNNQYMITHLGPLSFGFILGYMMHKEK